MRDLFINAFEWVIHVAVFLGAAGITVLTFGIAMQGIELGGGLPALQGIGPALAVFFGGMLALIVVAGAIYVPLGIYANTRRTADALELLITLRRG